MDLGLGEDYDLPQLSRVTTTQMAPEKDDSQRRLNYSLKIDKLPEDQSAEDERQRAERRRRTMTRLEGGATETKHDDEGQRRLTRPEMKVGHKGSRRHRRTRPSAEEKSFT